MLMQCNAVAIRNFFTYTLSDSFLFPALLPCGAHVLLEKGCQPDDTVALRAHRIRIVAARNSVIKGAMSVCGFSYSF